MNVEIEIELTDAEVARARLNSLVTKAWAGEEPVLLRRLGKKGGAYKQLQIYADGRIDEELLSKSQPTTPMLDPPHDGGAWMLKASRIASALHTTVRVCGPAWFITEMDPKAKCSNGCHAATYRDDGRPKSPCRCRCAGYTHGDFRKAIESRTAEMVKYEEVHDDGTVELKAFIIYRQDVCKYPLCERPAKPMEVLCTAHIKPDDSGWLYCHVCGGPRPRDHECH